HAAGLRDALVRVADVGVVEVERPGSGADLPVREATQGLQRGAPAGPPTALLASTNPNIYELEQDGRVELLAGEAQLTEMSAQAIGNGDVAAVGGWISTAPF